MAQVKYSVVSIKNSTLPWLVGQSVGALSCTPKGGMFDSQSGHVLGCGLDLVRVCTGGNQSIFLSLINVFLSLKKSIRP